MATMARETIDIALMAMATGTTMTKAILIRIDDVTIMVIGKKNYRGWRLQSMVNCTIDLKNIK